MQSITTFTTQFNNLNIACVILSQYDSNMIQQLKQHNFKYFSKTKEWSKTGFNDLTVFEHYCIAIFNNDTTTIKKLEPKQKDLKADLIKLAAIKYKNKKEYIKQKNQTKINELQAIYDEGTAQLLCAYCIHNKINFWDITTDTINNILINNIELLQDIIDYNNTNNINTCDYVNNIYNDGLPF